MKDLGRLVLSVDSTCRTDDQSPCCQEMKTGRYNKVSDWSHQGAKLSPLVKTEREGVVGRRALEIQSKSRGKGRIDL